MSEQKTHAEIIARMRSDAEKDEYTPDGILGQTLHSLADSLEAAQRREIDVLKRRINELDAEIAAKDEVIKRLNDAIAEDQRRRMATAENSSAVGDESKLRETVEVCLHAFQTTDWTTLGTSGRVADLIQRCKSALAAPARNCDTKESIDAVVKRFKAENCDHYDNAIDDPRTQCHQNCVECVIKWMMANQIKEETK